jgi:hypothetical protein
MKKTIFTLMFFVLFLDAQAAVWNSSQHWNNSWEQRYSNWIATSVKPDFFKNLGSPFSNLRIDCADAHYALRAYFAQKHGLHFVVERGALSNKTTRFDGYGSSTQKLYRFMVHLANNYGTESIVHNDTYPVAVNDIQPGDLFMYKVGSNGNYTRHTYIIKNINLDGTFDVIYSTQDRAKKGRALGRHWEYMFDKAPLNSGVDRNHWGFRRHKPSNKAHLSQESISESDFSQYTLANRYGNLGFFRRVKSINQTVKESPNRIAERNFKAVCTNVKDRVKSVQSGVNYNNSIGGRCMSFQDYDTYSTPSRDTSIKNSYLNYEYDVENVSWSRLNDYNQNLFSWTFDNSLSNYGRNELIDSCPVSTSIGMIDLSSFRINLFNGRVSFHPNDNIYRRWGFTRGSKTSCTEFYGYPEL